MAKRRLERSLRVTFLGLLVNAGLAAVKIAAGVIGHSHALVADGVESSADLISSLIVWRGVTLAAEPPDAEHPYGHGKAEPLAAAVVSTILIFAALWIVVGAAENMVRPHTTPAPYTLAVLVIVVIIKELMFRHVHQEGADLQSSVIRADAWHHRSDAITSLFAFVGISLAIVGGGRYAAADDYAAILAGLVIARNGWNILQPSMNELMDIAPDPRFAEKIRAIAEKHPQVARVEKCLMRKMGNEYQVDMHIEVDPKMTVQDAHAVAHQVKDTVRRDVPEVRDVLIHIEPVR
ncbi:MAG TPA: cation diffusion facilitator family transporter [Verrucomicrobiae bacterium]|jgi:cation diffusion facilitator family transporter|nr:cation diffusion facilitator family transporter [Verrucomicrobiae bacterium]